jgi:hypothetical protein
MEKAGDIKIYKEAVDKVDAPIPGAAAPPTGLPAGFPGQ